MSATQSTDTHDERPHQSEVERLPSQTELFSLLQLLPDGSLRWRGRVGKKVMTGRMALTAINADGYRCGQIHRRMVLAHRVVFKMAYGYEPVEVDHRDGDRLNNRPDNLIPADKTVNGRNQKLRSTNTSGVCGVSWSKPHGRWVAKIRTGGGRRKTLGYYDTLAEAANARKAAESSHGYSARHGTKQASHAQDGFSEAA